MGIHVSGTHNTVISQSNGRVNHGVHLRIHCFGTVFDMNMVLFGTVWHCLALFGHGIARLTSGLTSDIDLQIPSLDTLLGHSWDPPWDTPGTLPGTDICMGWALAIPTGVCTGIPTLVPTRYTPTPGTPLPATPVIAGAAHGHRPQRLADSIKTVYSGPPIYRQWYSQCALAVALA